MHTVHGSWRSRAILALADIHDGLRAWRIWWLLGFNDIRQRYRRSALGQFWITASMGIFVLVIGLVYSQLFRATVTEYLPYLVVNYVVWSFIAACMNDACVAFIQSEGYLRQERLPLTVVAMRLLVRNTLIFAHNAVLIPIVFVFFSVPVSWTCLLAIPGFFLLLINGFLVIMFIAMASTRFRDLLQVMANVVQIGFFVTPVMWQPSSLSQTTTLLIDLNPFANHLLLVSGPLLGHVPDWNFYAYCSALTLVLIAIVGPIFVRLRERVVYWL